MQKRVHFAPTNTVFSSRTPSPVLSDTSSSREDSSSDSSSVSTPPPEVEYDQRQQQQQQQQPQQAHYHQYYPQSPFPHSHDVVALHPNPHYTQYNSPPQTFFHPSAAQVVTQQQQHFHHEVVVPKSPPSHHHHMNIHLLLAFHPDMDIPLRYDLSNGFITSQITNEDLWAAATEPPLTSLVIICPHLAWEIHVAPSPSSSSSSYVPSPYSPDGGILNVGEYQQQRDHVTVYDVLRCLHRSLRQVVTPEEYDTLAPIGSSREAVDSAYHMRVGRIDDLVKRMRDEKYGIRRIDFLQGMNMFRGLAGTLVGPNVWELNVTGMVGGGVGGVGGGAPPVLAIAASTASVI